MGVLMKTRSNPTAEKIDKPVSLKITEPVINYPEQINIVYANYASFIMSTNDFTIDFGIRHDQQIKNKSVSTVNMNTRVIMSPQQVKTFSEKLSRLVFLYEENFGKINTEPIVKKNG